MGRLRKGSHANPMRNQGLIAALWKGYGSWPPMNYPPGNGLTKWPSKERMVYTLGHNQILCRNTCVRMYVCMYVCMHVSMYVCMVERER